MSPTPFALPRLLQPLDKTLINEAGHLCRPQLTPYRQVDLLNSYMVPVAIPTSSTPHSPKTGEATRCITKRTDSVITFIM